MIILQLNYGIAHIKWKNIRYIYRITTRIVDTKNIKKKAFSIRELMK